MISIIDHLVYAVPDLEKAIINFEKNTGIAPVYGGRHIERGTHNALVRIGKRSYLEFLAIDKSNTNVKAPYWMGLDHIHFPKLTHWAFATTDFEKGLEILSSIDPQLASPIKGRRTLQNGVTLEWKMTSPVPNRHIEVLPFMIDWGQSAHPVESLPNECQLIHFSANHPNPALLSPFFEQIGFRMEIQKWRTITLKAVLQTPKGSIAI